MRRIISRYICVMVAGMPERSLRFCEAGIAEASTGASVGQADCLEFHFSLFTSVRKHAVIARSSQQAEMRERERERKKKKMKLHERDGRRKEKQEHRSAEEAAPDAVALDDVRAIGRFAYLWQVNRVRCPNRWASSTRESVINVLSLSLILFSVFLSISLSFSLVYF